MHIAIVGAGLIGSAAARHAAALGATVTLIGPDEPIEAAGHAGPFGSHWDEGRITRGLDAVPFWSVAARLSIARYAQIAAQGGRAVLREVGAGLVGPPAAPLRAVAP
ncbi:MAG: FAD-dependent oxidoreductase, partial [Shimia sp.]